LLLLARGKKVRGRSPRVVSADRQKNRHQMLQLHRSRLHVPYQSSKNMPHTCPLRPTRRQI